MALAGLVMVVAAGMAVRAVGEVKVAVASSGQQNGWTAYPQVSRVADFAWLAGRWTGVAGSDMAEEICTEASHHTMSCMIQYMDAEKVTQLEFVTLREVGNSSGMPPALRKADEARYDELDRALTIVEERARFYPPDLAEKAGDDGITLRLASHAATEFVFDNAKVNEAVKHLRYIRNGADEFTSHLDLMGADGKPRVMEAKWKRALDR